MAEFGLDWVKFKTQTAVLFKTQVSIIPALQACSEVFDFSHYLCHCGIKAEPPNKKLQQLTLPQHSTLYTMRCTAYFIYNKPRKVFFHCEAFPKSD